MQRRLNRLRIQQEDRSALDGPRRRRSGEDKILAVHVLSPLTVVWTNREMQVPRRDLVPQDRAEGFEGTPRDHRSESSRSRRTPFLPPSARTEPSPKRSNPSFANLKRRSLSSSSIRILLRLLPAQQHRCHTVLRSATSKWCTSFARRSRLILFRLPQGRVAAEHSRRFGTSPDSFRRGGTFS